MPECGRLAAPCLDPETPRTTGDVTLAARQIEARDSNSKRVAKNEGISVTLFVLSAVRHDLATTPACGTASTFRARSSRIGSRRAGRPCDDQFLDYLDFSPTTDHVSLAIVAAVLCMMMLKVL